MPNEVLPPASKGLSREWSGCVVFENKGAFENLWLWSWETKFWWPGSTWRCMEVGKWCDLIAKVYMILELGLDGTRSYLCFNACESTCCLTKLVSPNQNSYHCTCSPVLRRQIYRYKRSVRSHLRLNLRHFLFQSFGLGKQGGNWPVTHGLLINEALQAIIQKVLFTLSHLLFLLSFCYSFCPYQLPASSMLSK